jgi:protein kinase C substrate 80K-H
VLPSARVNDDYCDCPDGSDEPGTSACAYLSHLSPSSPADIPISDTNTTLALPGFYCKNKGHQASYLPFLSVNDGVCDYELCCDGSDEWAGVGGTKCEDRCKEIGKEWRKNDERRKKSMAGALKKRRELVAEAGRLRKEVEDRIGTLKAEIGASEVKVKNLEQELADVERRERGKVVKGGGPGKSKVNVLAGLAKERVEELRETLIDVRAQRDMIKERMGELEAMLTKFKEEYNPNFNDEGVKRAVRSWEEYAAKDKVGDTEEAYERDLDEIVKPDDAEGGVNWAEWDTVEEESDVEVCTSALPTLLFPTITNHPSQYTS